MIAVIDGQAIKTTSMIPTQVGCVETEESDCGGIWFEIYSSTLCETHWVEVDPDPEWYDWFLMPVENALDVAKYWEGTDYDHRLQFKVMCDEKSGRAPEVDRTYRCETLITLYDSAGCSVPVDEPLPLIDSSI